ncbi:MAG: tRNA (adenosine(37)-N6)-threonylcarbamoyltransferase complex ATPase subunit type 1 TsaE [Rhodocyclaceae bacterium]|nr:tRNA (adenosine(37)-N6)-threonylcarbamoyltransferase complex ATPase subunit type 1 TsaE [Rhodocyclaceae bacterium]
MHSLEPTISPNFSAYLPDEAASAALAGSLAPCLRPGIVIYLEGDLGAGKTTLVRAMLRALGHAGPVKSPTYALVEVYVVSSLYWYHFDFYRFNHPEEFVDAGLDEYFRCDAVCLVEWPDKAAGFVPAADLVIALGIAGEGRNIEVSAHSAEGESCLNAFRTALAASSCDSPVALPSSCS